MTTVITKDRNAVRLILLNRPGERNALNTDLARGLINALDEAEDDGTVRAIVLGSGTGDFCAGADQSEFEELPPDRMHQIESRARMLATLAQVLPMLKKPVLCAVVGAAVGEGAALVLSADMAIMGRSATLTFAGLHFAGRDALALAGAQRAMSPKAFFEFSSMGGTVSSARAAALGLASRVVSDEQVLRTTIDLAEQLAGFDPAAIAGIKAHTMPKRA